MAKTTPPNSILVTRKHPSHPILLTPESVEQGGYTRVLLKTPRYLPVRGLSSNRFDLGATLTMPEGVVARVLPIQPDAYAKGYTVDSPVLQSGDEVVVFLRSHVQRSVDFQEGSVIGQLVFSRLETLSVGMDVALPTPTKKVTGRDGKAVEVDA